MYTQPTCNLSLPTAFSCNLSQPIDHVNQFCTQLRCSKGDSAWPSQIYIICIHICVCVFFINMRITQNRYISSRNVYLNKTIDHIDNVRSTSFYYTNLDVSTTNILTIVFYSIIKNYNYYICIEYSNVFKITSIQMFVNTSTFHLTDSFCLNVWMFYSNLSSFFFFVKHTIMYICR